MDWQTRMNRALDYLESELEGDIDWTEAASRAACSSFHFLRMFEVVMGVSAPEYVRRRRLSLAALELARGNDKIIDLALRFGYDSPDSFARAFKREFGITPSEARSPGAPLKTWPRLVFSIELKGTRHMDYRIESHDVIHLTGLPLETSVKDGRNITEIPEFWGRVARSGDLARLDALSGRELGVVGVSADMDMIKETFTYLIGIETPVDRSRLPEGCVDLVAPAATWAIFESVGALPSAIQALYPRIFGEWFPTSGYEHADGPELEVYPAGDTSAADYRCEVWMPVVKTAP